MFSAISSVVRRSNAMAQRLALRVVEGNMTSLVRITRGGEDGMHWDPAHNAVVTDEPQVIWEPDPHAGIDDPPTGIATVEAVSGPVTMALGDEPQYFQSTFISIPLRANQPEVDDVVTILDSPDPKLVGRAYRVVDVERGGQLPVAHRMQVVGIQPGRTWRQP